MATARERAYEQRYCRADYGGYPVRADTVKAHAERGAYGRSFYSDALDPELADLVRQVLLEHGYEPEPAGREYRPRPVGGPEDAATRLQEALAALEPVQTDFGQRLLRDAALETAGQALDLPQLGDWQARQPRELPDEVLADIIAKRIVAKKGAEKRQGIKKKPGQRSLLDLSSELGRV